MTTDPAHRADEALDRLLKKARAEAIDDGLWLANFVQRAYALAEKFNPTEAGRDYFREIDRLRDEIVHAWRSDHQDVAVAVAAVFARRVLEPSGDYPQAIVPALAADLALAGATPRWAGNEVVHAVAALLEVPLTDVEQRVFGWRSDPQDGCEPGKVGR